jgi:PAS domain S-box-containing protein
MNTGMLAKGNGEVAWDAHEVQSRYQRLLKSVTDYVYSVTVKDGKPASTSHGPGCTAVTGYTPEEFEADPYLWLHMVHAGDRAAVLARADQILAGEVPPPLEHRIICKNGTVRWIRNTAVPHRDGAGKLVMYDGLVADITERKEAELALRESQERLALVIQGSSDGIWDWDLVTDEIYFSPRWKEMLGYEDHEVDNHLSAWLRLLHPEDCEPCLARMDSHLSGSSPTYEFEQRLRHKDGSYRWILARGVARRDPDGRPVRMAGSHVDLTERKLAEEQLRAAYAELKANQADLKRALEELRTAHEELQAAQLHLIQAARLESVGTLAAGVAHEVKNPLHTIVLGLDFLDRSVPHADADTVMVLQEMRDAVNRADKIICEMRQLSENRDFDPKEDNLNLALEDALHLLRNDFLAAQIAITCDLAPDLPLVWVDKTRIEQVFLNLFINAVHAMPQGGALTITTRVERFSRELNVSEALCPQFRPGELVVVVRIHDTGTGISEANLPRIFEPFFTTKPVGVGSGLGLSLVKRVVDLHRGAISIRNARDRGVVATIILKPGKEAPAAVKAREETVEECAQGCVSC